MKNSLHVFAQSYGKGYAATAHLLADLCESIHEKGSDVFVYCPSHEFFYQSKVSFGVPVRCLNARVRLGKTRGFIHVFFSWIEACKIMYKQASLGNVILLMDTPRWTVLTACLLRLFFNFPVAYWCMDVPFEKRLRRKQEGIIKYQLARIASSLWFHCIRSFTRIVVLGTCMKSLFINKRILENKIEVIGVWSDISLQGEQITPYQARGTLGIPQKFTILYSGFAGQWHSFDSIEKIIYQFKDNNDIQFLFSGSGPGLDHLKCFVRDKSLKNVIFRERCALDILPVFLSTGDMHLVTLSEDMLGVCNPSKTYAAFAVGRPVIFIGPSECQAAVDITTSQAGSVFSETDIQQICEYIEGIRREALSWQKLSDHAAETFQKHHEKNIVCNKWYDFLSKISCSTD